MQMTGKIVRFCECAILSVCTVSSALALTCPTDIKQNTKGYWYSIEIPGWHSKVATPTNVTVNAKDFGAVVYSPERQRLACVYRTSNKKWIALVSSLYADIHIDKSATDDSGSAPAWRWNNKHKDYSCGKPYTKSLKNCTFQFVFIQDEKNKNQLNNKNNKLKKPENAKKPNKNN